MDIEYFWYKIQLHNYVVGYSYFKHNLIFGWNLLMVSFYESVHSPQDSCFSRGVNSEKTGLTGRLKPEVSA